MTSNITRSIRSCLKIFNASLPYMLYIPHIPLRVSECQAVLQFLYHHPPQVYSLFPRIPPPAFTIYRISQPSIASLYENLTTYRIPAKLFTSSFYYSNSPPRKILPKPHIAYYVDGLIIFCSRYIVSLAIKKL